MRLLLLCLLSTGVAAQSFYTDPKKVAQGQTLKVHGDSQATTARFNQRSIRLFPQTADETLGLMPVGVLTKPGSYDLEWLDAHDVLLYRMPIVVANGHYAKQNVVLSKALSDLKSTSDERELVAAFLKEVSPVRYWREPLESPIPGCITSPFGVRRLHNGKPTGDYHAGLDQRGATGTPIHPVTAGVVKIVRQFVLRGGTVAVDHGQGFESIYLHMSDLVAKEGDHVTPADVLGLVGSSGRSTGAHLHWTLYANGQPVNPLQWVRKLQVCPPAGGSATPHGKRPRTNPETAQLHLRRGE